MPPNAADAFPAKCDLKRCHFRDAVVELTPAPKSEGGLGVKFRHDMFRECIFEPFVKSVDGRVGKVTCHHRATSHHCCPIRFAA